MKKLGSYAEMSMHKDEMGNFVVDIKGVGPIVAGPQNETFSVNRSPADDQGKPENSYDLKTTASARSIITHQAKGGKFGALIEVRDQSVSTIARPARRAGLQRLGRRQRHPSAGLQPPRPERRHVLQAARGFRPRGRVHRALGRGQSQRQQHRRRRRRGRPRRQSHRDRDLGPAEPAAS